MIETTNARVLARERLVDLFDALVADGRQLVAPVVRDGVLCLRPVDSMQEIALGWRDEQAPGHYRIAPDQSGEQFGAVVGPDSGKRFFFPPHQRLFSLRVGEQAFELVEGGLEPPRTAIFGLHACDLAAIEIQDKVFGLRTDDGPTFRCESEAVMTRARADCFLVAIDCTRPGGTCFCASWGSGPAARSGFDLALTELRSGYLVRPGSANGEALLARLETRAPWTAEIELAELKLQRASEHMGRQLDSSDLRELLAEERDHHLWEEIGRRCLGCGNCTMVCPTCFCSTVSDSNDLVQGAFVRTREWESCFTHQFSYVTSGPVRSSTAARYRHWLTHKLSGWWEQFGQSGCVGCGRCITWCPVGIDWVKEIERLRRSAAVEHADAEARA